jgi:hypothetical protein
MNSKPYTITIGELLEYLKNYDRSDRLYFGNGDLSFHRVKTRGDMATIEFNQLYQVTADPETDPKV